MKTSKAYARMKRGAACVKRNSPRCTKPRESLLLFLAAFLLAWVSLAGFAGCGGGGASSITIQVTPGITQNVDQGQSLNFTATLSNDTQNLGVTWTLTGSGCSGNGCGTLSGNTPTFVTFTAPTGQGSQLTVTLTATSNASKGVTKTVTINVVLPPTFTTTSLPNGTNGIPYNQAIVVSGGVPPLSFTVGSGTIPPGLSLDISGTLLGTPTCPGSVPTPACPANAPNTYSFVVKVTDSGNPPLTVPSNLFTVIISPPPPLTITSSGALPSATVNALYSTPILTSGGVPPFTWSILSGSLPAGLILNTTSGQITGTPNIATSGKQFSFTPQVQDSSIPRQVVSTPAPLTILVTQPPPLAITTESPLTPGTVATPYASFITATGGIPPYTFSISPGLLPSGLTLNASSGEITGTPVLVNNSTFTASVKDSGIVPSTATAPLVLNITAGTSNPDTVFANTYTFLFTGFDAGGTVLISGTFTANSSGVITGGSEDIIRKSGITQAASLTGTYSIGTDGRGSFQLTAKNSVGQTVTDVFQFALESDGSAGFFANDTALNWADTPTRGSGIMKRQVGGSFASANFSGNYAFGFSGQDSGGKPAALAGFVHADGGQTLSPGTLDYNDAGTYSPAVPLSGNFAVTTAGGRGTASFLFQPPTTAQLTLNYAFYMVSSNDLFFVAIDPTDATHPRLGGEMILQNPTTVLDNAALNGVSVATGTGLATNASVFAGFLTGNGNGSAFVSYNENNGGAISTPSFASAYRVLTSGRVNLTSGLGPRIAAIYLTGQGQGFLIGSDSAATSGLLEQQNGNLPFGPSSFQGGFTLSAPFTAENQVADVLGQITADGTSTSQGIVDAFPAPGTPALNQKFGGAYNLGANGQGQMTTNTPTGIPTNLALFMVSPANVRAISTDTNDAHPEVIFIDH
jgi:putative Ig domain-containing protein